MIQRIGQRASVETPNLDAVPEPYRAAVEDMFDTWGDMSARNTVLKRYYDMKNEMKSLGISIPPMLEMVNCVTGWCAKAIKAHSVRSVFDGFVFDGAEDQDLKRLVRENRLRSLYRQACASALTYGVSAMTVMRGGPGQPEAMVRVFSANQFCCLWDKDARRIRCGVVLADVDRSGNASRYVCHFPDAVLTLVRIGSGSGPYEWGCETEPNPMGRPLMEVFTYDPDPDRPLGHSMLTPEILGIVDKAMRDVLRMEVGAEFFTFPQRYILGAKDDLFSVKGGDGGEGDGEDEDEGGPAAPPSPIAKFNAYVGSFLAITKDEDGDVPTVGQFAAPTADNFTRVFENDAQRFSGATNVPLAQLGVLSNTYTSSDALGAANDPLILEVEQINEHNAEALETVAQMMMAVKDGVPISGLTDEQRAVQACFKDPRCRPSRRAPTRGRNSPPRTRACWAPASTTRAWACPSRPSTAWSARSSRAGPSRRSTPWPTRWPSRPRGPRPCRPPAVRRSDTARGLRPLRPRARHQRRPAAGGGRAGDRRVRRTLRR